MNLTIDGIRYLPAGKLQDLEMASKLLDRLASAIRERKSIEDLSRLCDAARTAFRGELLPDAESSMPPSAWALPVVKCAACQKEAEKHPNVLCFSFVARNQ